MNGKSKKAKISNSKNNKPLTIDVGAMSDFKVSATEEQETQTPGLVGFKADFNTAFPNPLASDKPLWTSSTQTSPRTMALLTGLLKRDIVRVH